jgi:hypothetical protein
MHAFRKDVRLPDEGVIGRAAEEIFAGREDRCPYRLSCPTLETRTPIVFVGNLPKIAACCPHL